MVNLFDFDELKNLRGVGNVTLESFKKNNINNINDLLHYYPKTYSVYEEDPNEYFSGNYTLISGFIDTNPAFIKYRNKANAIIFYLAINNKKYKFIYFSGDYIRYIIKANMKISVYAKYIKNKNEFSVKKIFLDEITSKVECDYKIKNLKNQSIQKIIDNLYHDEIILDETLPDSLLSKYKLLNINEFIKKSHLPTSKNDVKEVLRRRKYEEFFWYTIKLELLKNSRYQIKKPLRSINYNLMSTFLSDLEFELTSDQKNVIKEIEKDILSNRVMNRLVQGDVGCGKSIISLYSALLLISAGYQAAIMLPTEILANQQFDLAKKYFEKYGIVVELLTSSVINKTKTDILYRLANNRVNLIIGTHSLIEDKVVFNRLGIVIIDEQHKFGVLQRQKLINKFKDVDALYLTATPIPRSLGMTMFGDLDISSIHTMPNERKKVITKIWPYDKIDGLMKSIDNELKKGNQAYIVVPKVLENENQTISINDAYNMFSQGLKNARIGICHGKMKSVDKNLEMEKFYKGITNVLISTTVIEVGMNVKKATVMVIMDANMFGLSQLHQLRGRVGRSSLESYCILLTNDVLNDRLLVIENESDGFKISEDDFKLRGPGSYIGENQSGYMDLEYSSFEEDFKIFECARLDSEIYISKFLKKEIKSPIFNDIIKSSKFLSGKNN